MVKLTKCGSKKYICGKCLHKLSCNKCLFDISETSSDSEPHAFFDPDDDNLANLEDDLIYHIPRQTEKLHGMTKWQIEENNMGIPYENWSDDELEFCGIPIPNRVIDEDNLPFNF